MENRYQVMYKITLALSVNHTNYQVSPSNIVSISMIHQYDTMTFPMIRIRLYCDLELIQNVAEYPDEIEVIGNFDAGTYLWKDEQTKPTLVSGATNFSFNMKAYLEHKNMPTSVMDQYRDGKKIEKDLNQTPKYTMELYCYDQSLVYYLRRQTESIYHGMCISSVIENMLNRGNITRYQMDPLNQNECFDQILIPNLSVMQALAFFDTYYGLYEKGAHVYGDIDQLYITNTSSDNYGNIVPIRVSEAQSNSDMAGLKKYNDSTYEMYILSNNITILSESDIERILQAEHIGAVNVNTLDIQSSSLEELYRYKTNSIDGSMNLPNLLHKHQNPFITSSLAARVKEKITKVQIAAAGFDIATMKVNTRYNLLFDTNNRSRDIRGLYRPSFVNHVFINQNDDMFIVNTTMQLCKN